MKLRMCSSDNIVKYFYISIAVVHLSVIALTGIL